MPARASMGIDLNLTGNLRSEVRGAARDVEQLNRSTSTTLGGGGPMRGAAVSQTTAQRQTQQTLQQLNKDLVKTVGKQQTTLPGVVQPSSTNQWIQQLVQQRDEKKLLEDKKKFQQREVRQFSVEQRYDRTENQSMIRTMGVFTQMAQFPIAPTAPFALAQRAGFGIMQYRTAYQQRKGAAVSALMQQGRTRGQAVSEAMQQPGMVAGAAKALMAHPLVGAAVLVAAGTAIATYKGSQMSREIVKPYVGGLARQGTYGPAAARHIIAGATRDVAGFGTEGVVQYMGGLQRFHYQGAQLSRLTTERVKSKELSRLGHMSRAMGVSVEETLSFQNLLTQSGMMEDAFSTYQKGKRTYRGLRDPAREGFLVTPRAYRVKMQRDVMARLNARFAGNMGMAMQQMTQVGQAEMAATGRTNVTDIANMAAMFGARNVGQIAPVITQMSGTLRGAAGTGTAREQFFMRAFGGNYQNAIQAMEGGMNVEKYRKIKEQLGKEGYSGFGMHLRMKQLGLFQTTLAAQNYEQGFNKKKAGDLDKQKVDMAERQKRFEGGIGGYGKFAAGIQTNVINAGLILTQEKRSLLPTAATEAKIYGKAGGFFGKLRAAGYIGRAQWIAGGAETGGIRGFTADTAREMALMREILDKIAILIGTKEGEKKIEFYLGSTKLKTRVKAMQRAYRKRTEK